MLGGIRIRDCNAKESTGLRDRVRSIYERWRKREELGKDREHPVWVTVPAPYRVCTSTAAARQRLDEARRDMDCAYAICEADPKSEIARERFQAAFRRLHWQLAVVEEWS